MKTWGSLAIIGLAALSMTGCATAAPAPAETVAAPVTPSAAPEADPVAESIVIGGLSFSIVFDTGESTEFDYASDPGAAIEALTTAFGADPEVTVYSEVSCGAPFTATAWNGFSVFSDTDGLPPGQEFRVFAEKSAPLPVAASDGSVLGEDNAAVIAATDDRFVSTGESKGETNANIYFDVQDLTANEELYDDSGPVSDSDDGKFAWGGVSYSTGGIVQRISAPTLYIDC